MTAADPIKVYDARWEVDDFDDDAVRRLFEAALMYGRELGVDTVTVARDARLAAPHVTELAVETALGMGLRVFLCADPVSTPLSYFTAQYVSGQHPATLGLTITASHNPSDYIGVKITVPGVRAIGLDCGPAGGFTRIRELYHGPEKPQRQRGGRLRLVDVEREYVAFAMQRAGVEPNGFGGMGVVLDAFHGSGGAELLDALTRAGAVVEPLRLMPDGRFPTGSPNPTSRGKMDRAVELCRQQPGRICIGLDGDGDRIVFGDRRGVLSAGIAAVAVLRNCVPPRGTPTETPVLYDPKVSPLALAEWARMGLAPVLFRNGHSQIKEQMRQVRAEAGVEESGHYYHRLTFGDLTVCCENAVFTVLSLLASIRGDRGLMDELWAVQGRVATTGEFNYAFADDDARDRAMQAVVAGLTDNGTQVVTATPGGVDLEGTVLTRGVTAVAGRFTLTPDWFSGYIRIATTERAVVRAYFSAGDPDTCHAVESRTRRILEQDCGGQPVE